MPDPLDLYGLKRAFARANELGDLLHETADPALLRRARRALLPIRWIEHPPAVENPLRRRAAGRPVPALADKRVAVIATGAGGACVSLIGVARAFEEAGIRPASLTACSGGAIWGAMSAAGLSAYDMARFSLSWRPEEYLDIQWRHLPGFALSALRGFTGLAKGEAVEQLFEERLRGMAVGDTRFPITTIVYNMDLGRLGILRASRQLERGYHLEFAQRAKRRLGDSLTIIDPVDYRELRGVSFYDLFIDRSHWPRLTRQGYEAGTRALDGFRERRKARAA